MSCSEKYKNFPPILFGVHLELISQLLEATFSLKIICSWAVMVVWVAVSVIAFYSDNLSLNLGADFINKSLSRVAMLC